MILPIGHENQEVRRLPWVSFTVIALCVITHLMVSRAMVGFRLDEQESITRVEDYWMNHPYLQLDPAFLEDLGISKSSLEQLKAQLPAVDPPEDPEELKTEQRKLDSLTRNFLRARFKSPYYRWGLMPKRVGMPGLVTHMFIHGGWLHLLGNLLFLYLMGPFIEDIWGRWLYGVFYLVMGVLAGLIYCLHYPDSNAVLIGASGAIAGVMGAFLVYFWKTRIRFAFFFAFLFSGTFKAPAWMMLPLWLGLEVLNADTMDRITQGQEGGGGVAHWAHVWGFVLGFLTALLLKWTGFVQRRITPALEKEAGLFDPGMDDYEEGLNLLNKGRFAEARDCFMAALHADPGNLNILEYLELTTRKTGETDLFIENAARTMEVLLRRDEPAAALIIYERLRLNAEMESLPLRVCALLVSPLLESGSLQEAKNMIESVMHRSGPNIPAGLLLPLVEPARSLGDTIQKRLKELVANRQDIPLSIHESLGKTSSVVSQNTEPAQNRRRNRQIRIIPAEPLRLGADSLVLRLTGGEEKTLALSGIHCIGVAAVTGKCQPLLLLIDLFLDDPAPDSGVLRTIRLASNTYNPRDLVSHHNNSTEAFSAFIQALLERSGAGAWPDARILDFRRISRYPDLDTYRLVLTQGAR